MTVRDLVKSSLRLLGVIAPGETPQADELQEAMQSFSLMVDSWETDGFVVPWRIREEFTIAAGQATFTLGVGGDLDTERPVAIERAGIMDASVSPALETALEIINTSQYADITQKSLQGIPTKLYRAGTAPLDAVTLYPIPDTTKKLVLYTRKSLLTIANANTQLSLPPGYERAFKYNLAVELAPEYGKTVAPEVGVIAVDSKAAVLRLNGEPNYLEVGAAIAGVQYFNIRTGEF